MSNFDLSNQNDDNFEGLTSTPVTPKNNYDDGGLTSTPVEETVGNLSIEKPVETQTGNTVTAQKPRSDRSPRVKCPNCGSTNVEYEIRNQQKKKNIPLICLTLFFLWPLGLYLIFKKDVKAVQVRKCSNCGKEF